MRLKLDPGRFRYYYDQGWTVAALAERAPMSRTTATLIVDKGLASYSVIAKLAKIFGTTTKDLILEDEPELRELDDANFVNAAYRKLLETALLSNDFHRWAEENGGLFKADFMKFFRERHGAEVDAMPISVNDRKAVLQQLCSQKLLSRNLDPESRRKVRYYSRTWDENQCAESVHLRIGVEKLAIEYAIGLKTKSPSCYKTITDRQAERLEIMRRLVRHPQGNEGAAEVMKLDRQFHLEWGSTHQIYHKSLEIALAAHDQVMHRYALILETATKPIPPDYPTLWMVASSCYVEVQRIFDFFMAVECPDDKPAIERLMAAVEEHPTHTFDMLEKTKRFIREQG